MMSNSSKETTPKSQLKRQTNLNCNNFSAVIEKAKILCELQIRLKNDEKKEVFLEEKTKL